MSIIDIYGYMTPYNLQNFSYALSLSRVTRTLGRLGIMIPILQSVKLRCWLLMRRRDPTTSCEGGRHGWWIPRHTPAHSGPGQRSDWEHRLWSQRGAGSQLCRSITLGRVLTDFTWYRLLICKMDIIIPTEFSSGLNEFVRCLTQGRAQDKPLANVVINISTSFIYEQ